ncbi:MAG: sugar transferase [Lachnospiraceae bacterium]|nr:sugar transferase [Lachnospiraceae bacterium]
MILSVFIGCAIGAGLYKITKYKQKTAKRKEIHVPYGPYEAVIKRFLDIALSGIMLVLLSPIMITVSILIKLKLGSPIIFLQDRPGKDKKIFKLCKFRSMTNKKDAQGNLLPDSVRLTSFGRKLRTTSLDELPELLNIVKGDMSIVGPRPLLERYLPYYTEEENQRHCVRPGLTGLAQIHGRNNLGWSERLNYDVQYVSHITFWEDCKIIFSTILKVFKQCDVVKDGDYKMLDFDEERRNINGDI